MRIYTVAMFSLALLMSNVTASSSNSKSVNSNQKYFPSPDKVEAPRNHELDESSGSVPAAAAAAKPAAKALTMSRGWTEYCGPWDPTSHCSLLVGCVFRQPLGRVWQGWNCANGQGCVMVKGKPVFCKVGQTC
ncbi:hypothetical protein BCR33DRAFT_722464 [Rhizoclosmatium globosum]|uniref:CBM1 domain-containing protein n=1 Tax=Rhizoclosmatium globosum TaxID=329046 RepID=A0A1Y2BMJ5_9FUNG|nr:hypothetical protein BCR33DRAFT_722464 [Rhizoclosmatium globosum]|eukprot:ORY35991.1 hypothetical protein BCR33DRAFT_722464 [Rhizoclosmatium globosum]